VDPQASIAPVRCAVSGLTTRLVLLYAEREGRRRTVDAVLARSGLTGREAELRDEAAWFGPEVRLALWEAMAETLEDERVAERVGAAVLDFGIGEGLKRALRALGSPELVLRNIARANAKFSRAYRLEALSADRTRAQVRLVDVAGVAHDRFDCDYVRGLLRTVPRLFGMPAAHVEHTACALRGAPACTFDVAWRPQQQHARRGALLVGAGSAALAGAGAATGVEPLLGAAGALALAGTGAVGWRAIRVLRGRVRALEARAVAQDAARERIFASLGDLSANLRLDEVLDKIGQRASVAVEGKHVVLLVADGGRLRADRHSGIPAPALRALEAWAADHRAALDAGAPVLVDDVDAVAQLAGLRQEPAFAPSALCAAPLRSGDQLLGALVAVAEGGGVLLPHETAALGAYATQAAIALSNAHLVERLERQAAQDPLTDLANQRAFHRACVAAFAAAERDGTPVSVIALDLDHFKSINDVHGHLYGDEVLRATADALRGAVRPADTVARVGGEEFMLLLPGAGPEAAFDIAERARGAVARVPLPDRALSCSAGVVTHPACGERRDRLVHLADRALYEAKERGRNRTVEHVADSPTAGGRLARPELAALFEDGGLEIVLQPIVMLATGRVICHEALARFPSQPGRAIPDVFREAHRAGLGPALEARAVRRALELPGRPAGTALSVNVSISTLRSPDVWDVLPADLSALVVEITEGELFDIGADLEQALARLRNAGARIALDDAGAGYSGLQQIVRVRPDIVKLDRSLVSGVASDPARAALVASFASFATQTGGAVCAEGIERRDDLQAIADLDIAYGQGFLLGRPAPGFAELTSEAARPVAATLSGGMRAFDRVARDEELSLGGSVPERLATIIATAANADRVDLWRLDRRSGELVAVRVPDRPAGARVPLAEAPARAHALATGEAGQVLRGDAAADRIERRALAAGGYGGVLLVPLDAGGAVLGLVACYRRRARPWSRESVGRVRSRAAPLASVLGNAGLSIAEPA
jgi:diguanylate cyclase (GGDEF)-like protein